MTCQFCGWKPGQEHDNGCPKKVSDPEEQEIALRAWGLGYGDAIYGRMSRAGPGAFYERGARHGQGGLNNAWPIDMDQIKPLNFDDQVLDDLFAGL